MNYSNSGRNWDPQSVIPTFPFLSRIGDHNGDHNDVDFLSQTTRYANYVTGIFRGLSQHWEFRVADRVALNRA